MTEHEGKNRPLYKVHCHTFERALTLCGIKSQKFGGAGIATRGNTSVIATFRAFPQYRDESAKVLRSMVALSIRMERFAKRAKVAA